MKKSYTLLAFAGVLGLTSCTTTGDPTQGGLFWSREKCETEYIAPLRAQEAESLARVNAAEAKRAKLLKQKAALESSLKAAKQQSAPASQVADLQNQLNTLQRQVDALNNH